MHDQIGRPAKNLCRKLERFEEHLRDLQKRTSTEHEVSRSEIERQIDAVKGALKRVKDDALAARARMERQAEGRELATSGQVEAWKHDRDGTERLRSRAEDAEAYAAWSLIDATQVFNEVELATLEAIAARMDFENGSTE